MQPSRVEQASIDTVQVNEFLEPMPRILEAQLTVSGENVGNTCPTQIGQQGSEPAIDTVKVEQAAVERDPESLGNGPPAQIPERVNLSERKLPACFRRLSVGLRSNPHRVDLFRPLAGNKASDGIRMPAGHL